MSTREGHRNLRQIAHLYGWLMNDGRIGKKYRGLYFVQHFHLPPPPFPPMGFSLKCYVKMYSSVGLVTVIFSRCPH
jgi:hypothetical protein